MELKDFIVNAVLDIQDAVIEINERTGRQYHIGDQRNTTGPQGGKVLFDVAVGQGLERGASGGARAGIPVVGAQIDGNFRSTNESNSRLKFELILSHVSTPRHSRRNPEDNNNG